jgi:hypothetical protein
MWTTKLFSNESVSITSWNMSTQKPTPAAPTLSNNPQDFASESAVQKDAPPATQTNTPPKKDLDYIKSKSLPKEKNGFADAGLLEPTRYGDWDVKGRCSDF